MSIPKDDLLLRLAKQLALHGQEGALIATDQSAKQCYSPGSRILRSAADVRQRRGRPPGETDLQNPDPQRLVLVVDDESTIIEWVSATLANQGFRVIGATNAIDAIDQIQRRSQLSLVITDMSMSPKDGLFVLEYLQRNLRFAHIPSIVYSGQYDAHIICHAIKCGAIDFIAKPCPSEVFSDRVCEAMAERTLKILLCSRDTISSSILAKMLNSAGYSVDRVDDGNSALRALSSTRRQLVITEFLLNDMTGLDLLQGASAHSNPPPFVFIEEPSLKLKVDTVKAVGGYGLIFRPFKSNEIVQLVRSLERFIQFAHAPGILTKMQVQNPADIETKIKA
ncbi:MAG: response regulator [Candidatus Zixiibacteriota bacterium]